MRRMISVFAMAMIFMVSSMGLTAETPAGVDIGKIMAGVQEKRVIPVENTTNASMSIAKVNVSCDCIKVLSYPRRLAAAEKGKIVIVVAPKIAGQYNYVLTLEQKTPGAPSLKYNLLLTVLGR